MEWIQGMNAAVNYIEEHILEENFRITPKFWADCAMDGTIVQLASMMDTPIYGLMGVSTCNESKNMAFFHSLTEENYDAIEKLIRSELGEL